MEPLIRLIDKNIEHQLTGRIVTIGSSPECHLKLPGVPGRAAHLLFGQGVYTLHRLTPEIVISVDDAEIGAKGVVLRHGSEIRIGGSRMEYLEHGGSESNDASTPLRGDGSADLLQELIGIAVSLLRSRDEALFDALAASVSRLLRGDGARIVIDGNDGQECQTIARYPKSVGLDRFSNRAIRWAREASHTVLMHEDAWRSAETSMRSLEKNLVASIMCAPLKHGDAITGYLYIDRIDDADPFTEEDRRFCDALLPLFSEIIINYQERREQQTTIARLQSQRMAPSGGMLFESECMVRLVALATRLAGTDSPVLITGETGTGKELLARFVHDQSSRSSGPYKAINCGAIPENLIESELFGHEKGAFTGAVARKAGLFESAQGGTVFLDEIGELPIHLQVKLLRVLQESEVIRVGGTETIPVDIRIVAATNRNLEAEASSGNFRQDLFFRLNVLTLHLPPLRERGNDVLLLAEYFITRYCQQFGLAHKVLSASAKNALAVYQWPGNIRELENVLQKAILFSESDRLTPESISLRKGAMSSCADGPEGRVTLREARAAAERSAIASTLRRTRGNVSMAGKMLDIDRKWLIKKMEELGIEAGEFRR